MTYIFAILVTQSYKKEEKVKWKEMLPRAYIH